MARFIVNHGGIVHCVPDEQFALHLGAASLPRTPEDPVGKPAREATPDEIDAWYAAQGLPNPDRPATSTPSSKSAK